MVRDGESAAAQVRVGELAVASPGGCVLKPRGDGGELQILRVMDDRNNQPPVAESDANTYVEVIEDLQMVIVPAAIDLRRRLHGFDNRHDDVGRVRKIDAFG